MLKLKQALKLSSKLEKYIFYDFKTKLYQKKRY